MRHDKALSNHESLSCRTEYFGKNQEKKLVFGEAEMIAFWEKTRRLIGKTAWSVLSSDRAKHAVVVDANQILLSNHFWCSNAPRYLKAYRVITGVHTTYNRRIYTIVGSCIMTFQFDFWCWCLLHQYARIQCTGWHPHGDCIHKHRQTLSIYA